MAELSVEWRQRADYEQGIDKRLSQDSWKEGVVYTFMGETEGRGPEAVALPVDLRELRATLTRASFILCLKDIDLNTCLELPSTSVDGIWTPNAKAGGGIRITAGHAINIVVKAAYFKPYEGDVDMPTLEDILSIDRSMAMV